MRKTSLVLALLLLTDQSSGAAEKITIAACAPCHGLDGIGHDAEIPNLAGQNEAYLLNQLRAFRDKRRRHKEMMFMGRKLDDAEMKILAAYYANLSPR
jgi:cytochrome c553